MGNASTAPFFHSEAWILGDFITGCFSGSGFLAQRLAL
jgi:hypothetical protein